MSRRVGSVEASSVTGRLVTGSTDVLQTYPQRPRAESREQMSRWEMGDGTVVLAP